MNRCQANGWRALTASFRPPLSPPPFEQVVAHHPLLAAVEPEQLRARQVEQPPVHVPLPPPPLPVRLLQDRLQLPAAPVLVHEAQPGVARLLVVPPVHAPVVRRVEVIAEVEQEVVARHRPAGEEVVGHPALVEVIGVAEVGEDVEEELAGGFEKAVDLGIRRRSL